MKQTCPTCDGKGIVHIPVDLDGPVIRRVLLSHAAVHDTQPSHILSGSRVHNVVKARHEAMRELHSAGYTVKELCILFDRDHSSVIHALKELSK